MARRKNITPAPALTDVKAIIQAMADANGGFITNDEVVEAASDPNSPLHDHFDWNDRTAAHKHRLAQAGALIRSCKIVIKTDKTEIKSVAYVRNPNAEPKQQGYISVAKLKTDEELAREAVVDAFQKAARMLQRARNLAKVLEMEDEVDTVVRTVEEVGARLAS